MDFRKNADEFIYQIQYMIENKMFDETISRESVEDEVYTITYHNHNTQKFHDGTIGYENMFIIRYTNDEGENWDCGYSYNADIELLFDYRKLECKWNQKGQQLY
ncbi:MAG: hypothetical protein RR444_03945 [Oscillospiraceae bacterium]